MKPIFALLPLVMAAILGASLNARGQVATDSQSFEQIERGRYLATIGDCVACHTAPGGKPYAGGLPIDTPFGKLVSPNITPDRATGIGAWTDDQFVQALQQGISPRGHLYPAMPYPAYTKVSRDDIIAIRAFLNTLQPVTNHLDLNQLRFPYNIRENMRAWNALHFTPGEFKPDPDKSAQWNRGAYLVEGLGHCGTCHTPKTPLGGDRNNDFLQGATLQSWFAPDLTSSMRKGLGGWSLADIVQYLKTGVNRHTVASGPMAEAITNSTSKLQDQDLMAIATYLKDLPSDSATALVPVAADDKRMVAGKAIYQDTCSACHQETGEGAQHLFPALAGNAVVQSANPTTLIRVVLAGSQGVATAAAPTAPAMPSFAWRLSDEEIASLLTYVRNSWGNAAAPVEAAEVTKLRQTLTTVP
ncbi:c-type cytochrome [Phyllobacterium leguminum]|uniref:Mono/diheme cytochrome c family protein n=1 Tax=Phyllobacterium leguminum TaxID=314237 RepID=A0A318T4W8_9HYPH|nr:cytochrome c [Phyllobacterium leguminum]PYE87853.1 mono/diheme cytochrome c family protein [Phyllobacterium leguminum]